MTRNFRAGFLLQPLLIASFPIIKMFAANPHEVTIIQTTIMVAIISLAVIVGFFFFSLLTRNFFKAAIYTNLFTLLFYAITPLIHRVLVPLSIQTFDITMKSIRIFRVRNTLILVGIVCTYLIVQVAKKCTSPFLTRMLIFPLLILVFLSVATGTMQRKTLSDSQRLYRKQHQPFQDTLTTQVTQYKSDRPDPDIYFIILDAYSSQSFLQEQCNFDNTPFLQALEKRGFVITAQSLSNYRRTTTSLPATLNMDYLPQKLPMIPFGYMWRNNTIAHVLQQRGYTYVDLQHTHKNVAQSNTTTSFIKKIIQECHILMTDYFALGRVFIESYTPLYAFLSKHFFASFRKHINTQLEMLNTVAATPKYPQFVYAHFLATHMPLVFAHDGSPLIVDESQSQQKQNLFGYTQAIQYINTRILESIDIIQNNATTPPIIVVQADHGANTSDFHTDDRLKILSAYHLPHGGNKKLYQTISPVNNFRLILRHYFGATLPLLPDNVTHNKETQCNNH